MAENLVCIIYNGNHPPYIYGSILRIKKETDKQKWGTPFVVSTKLTNGKEIIHGTINKTLDKVTSQILRIGHFGQEIRDMLSREGLPNTQNVALLGNPEIAERIMKSQEEFIEDVFLNLSVHVRLLYELFEPKFKRRKLKVYNYDGVHVGDINFKWLSNLMVHHVYFIVKDEYIVDLMSDDHSLTPAGQTGFKIHFGEYVEEVVKVVNSLTLKDFASVLKGKIEKLSASSSIKEIIFVHQNLYTLGYNIKENLLSKGRIDEGFVQNLINKASTKYLERNYPPVAKREESVYLEISTPHFYLDSNLDNKRIKAGMKVNEEDEFEVMELDKFFKEMIASYGQLPLTRPI